MPDLDYSVPAAATVRALDSAVYASGAGYPASSHIGVRMAETDRFLAANVRRSFSYAFPLDDPPIVADYHGADLGEWDVEIAPVTRWCQFTLRVDLIAGSTGAAPTATFVPYVEQPSGGTPYLLPANATDLAALTVTGAGEQTVGPFLVDCSPGRAKIGVVIHSAIDTAPTAKTAAIPAQTGIRGAFRGAAALTFNTTSPPAQVITFYDAAGNLVGGPHQVIKGENGGTDALLWPEQAVSPAAVSYSVQEVFQVKILGIEWEEVPPTVLTAEASSVNPAQLRGPSYVAVPNEAAHSLQQFRAASHWFLLAQDAQHVVTSHGRILVQERYLDLPILGAGYPLAEVARFVTDDDPLGDELLVILRVSVAVADWWRQGAPGNRDPATINITAQVASEDTAGAFVTAETGILDIDKQMTGGVSFGDGGREGQRSRAMRVDWPWPSYTQLPEQTFGFIVHHPDLALPAAGRVIKIHATANSPIGGPVSAIYLRGVTVLSSRRSR